MGGCAALLATRYASALSTPPQTLPSGSCLSAMMPPCACNPARRRHGQDFKGRLDPRLWHALPLLLVLLWHRCGPGGLLKGHVGVGGGRTAPLIMPTAAATLWSPRLLVKLALSPSLQS